MCDNQITHSKKSKPHAEQGKLDQRRQPSRRKDEEGRGSNQNKMTGNTRSEAWQYRSRGYNPNSPLGQHIDIGRDEAGVGGFSFAGFKEYQFIAPWIMSREYIVQSVLRIVLTIASIAIKNRFHAVRSELFDHSIQWSGV